MPSEYPMRRVVSTQNEQKASWFSLLFVLLFGMPDSSGILATLDEEVFVPKGSEQGFLNKLNKAQGSNARFVQNK